MSVGITHIVAALVKAGATPEMILAAVAAYEAALPPRQVEDRATAYRREADRQRKAERRAECPSAQWDMLRQQTFERDGFACVYCGASGDLSADHLVPWADGGRSALDNLVTACRSCNSSKGVKSLNEWRR